MFYGLLTLWLACIVTIFARSLEAVYIISKIHTMEIAECVSIRQHYEVYWDTNQSLYFCFKLSLQREGFWRQTQQVPFKTLDRH